jgi:glyoxylase-like metal-dependent hydrolase (beta-lactamase superfamily II)
MFRKKFLLSSLFVAVVFAVTTTAHQPQGQPGAGGGQRAAGGGGRGPTAPLGLKEIKPGLYMVGGSGGNSIFRVTDNGVVLVDTKVRGEAYYNQLMDLIKIRSNQPVRYAVVTHVHIDHSGNIEFFMKNGTQVVAHENLLKNLETYTSSVGKPGKPNITYSKDYSIRLGDTEVAHVYHFASGHTSGDSIVHFPDLGVVAMGDELQLPNSYCFYELGGSIPGWAQSINEVLKLDFDLAVPGHMREEYPFGPATREALLALKAKLDSITRNAIELVKKGTPKDQLIAQIQAVDPNATVGAMLQNNQTRIDLFYEEILRLAK